VTIISYTANIEFPGGAEVHIRNADLDSLCRMVEALKAVQYSGADKREPAPVNAPPPTDAYQTGPTPSSQAPADPKPAPTYDDVRDTVLIRLGAKSRDAVVALLAKFGATKLSELRDQPAIFPDVIIEAERVLKELA